MGRSLGTGLRGFKETLSGDTGSTELVQTTQDGPTPVQQAQATGGEPRA
jgi:Sec-independent protein translocase protein TatA